MPDAVLQLEPRDNILVALAALSAGTEVRYGVPPVTCPVTENIPAKHKMALQDFAPGDFIRMYGMVVGEATQPILRGGLISTRNIAIARKRHGPAAALGFHLPDASRLGARMSTDQ